jgi:mutator protein MutT
MQQVTAALIQSEGKILLARRKAGKHMGSKWEFPGGKIDRGESPTDCLRRELAEEFGIEAEIGSFLGSTRFCRGDVRLKIRCYSVKQVAGNFVLHEHEELCWADPDQVESFDLVESDRKLFRKLRRNLT